MDGDPTDGALLVAAYKFGFHENDKQPFRIIKEIPFDSDRKRMSVVIEDDNGMRLLITKVHRTCCCRGHPIFKQRMERLF